MVALKAPGGIGKTRLIHEFINRTLKDASKRSYLILGRTTDLTRQPYFLFISLFRHYFDISEIDSPKDAAKKISSGYAELEKKLDGDDKKSLVDSKAMIDFSIPADVSVSLSVYNMQGREVSRLIDAKMDAGYHSMAWNANNLPSGIYFVKMVAGGHVVTQKLMLLK